MDLTGKPKLKQQLILIICKLADGSDCNARYEDEPKDATALEEALELFPDLIEWCNDLEMWDTCMTKLRKQVRIIPGCINKSCACAKPECSIAANICTNNHQIIFLVGTFCWEEHLLYKGNIRKQYD